MEGTTALHPQSGQAAAFFLSAAGNQLASPNRLTITATAAIAVSVSSVFSSSIRRSVTSSTVSDVLLALRPPLLVLVEPVPVVLLSPPVEPLAPASPVELVFASGASSA